ncbi:hypothetical protein Lal_00048723 [Lupinus albus]|uniref:Uncharacterized protein n=1 Tax=Lupinus albus TaxID=3870 RepID=A0A6A4P7C8_LUPAL|nr:hypothetical protein Lalb_Chr17g0348931 [Lupinus albus]KAF1864158.1 hypothetical protein Lal_00048723 [Lupinus albus]
MEISQRLLKLRYHFLVALLLSITLFTLLLTTPTTFITLFTYFWPLFVSTAIVLSLVFIFARTSSSSLPDTDSSLHKTLLDYVAAGHLHHEPSFLTHNNKSD